MIEQYSMQWYKERLGYFTGSQIYNLMVSGRKKDEMFGKTAISYIYKVASERALPDKILNDEYSFDIYNQLVNATSKTMEWGHDNEELAAKKFSDYTGIRIEKCGSYRHPTIPYLSASPDRIFRTKSGGIGIVEIKCPLPSTFIQYRAEIKDSETLKAVKPEYWWQIQTEMMCSGARTAFFVAFCPFNKSYLHVVKIEADEAAFKVIEERVRAAEAIVEDILTC